MSLCKKYRAISCCCSMFIATFLTCALIFFPGIRNWHVPCAYLYAFSDVQQVSHFQSLSPEFLAPLLSPGLVYPSQMHIWNTCSFLVLLLSLPLCFLFCRPLLPSLLSTFFKFHGIEWFIRFAKSLSVPPVSCASTSAAASYMVPASVCPLVVLLPSCVFVFPLGV